MAEYLAPGVYVEEVSFRSKSIEGVSTTTTGFIGPTRYGPLDIDPDIVTSLVEFERTYGGKERLLFGADDVSAVPMDNYMWQAVRAFFEEGGKRLYVSRVYTARPMRDGTENTDPAAGCSTATLGGSLPGSITLRARFPGAAGDGKVTLTLSLSQNVLVNSTPESGVTPAVRALRDRDVVYISDRGSPPNTFVGRGYYLARSDANTGLWTFVDATGASTPLSGFTPGATSIQVVTVSVSVTPLAKEAVPYSELNLPLDPHHMLGDTADSLFDAFAPHTRDPAHPNAKVIASMSRARTVPIVIENPGDLDNGLLVLNELLSAQLNSPPPPVPFDIQSDNPAARSLVFNLTGGNDGVRPTASAYAGEVDPVTDAKSGLRQFEDLEDISIVAAPGSTFGFGEPPYGPQSHAIVSLLISHAERMRYRIAVIDCGNNQSIADVRAMRAQFDSTYGALYYPWIRVLDPLTQKETYMPPSGFVAGIYARNDINRAVYKAPANEVVNLALGFERFLNKAQQEVLNPEGINCFRFFEGRGMRLWGARTISSDPEWKYVNLRRYFAYLERSIDKGTQWAVFEPNGDLLWANVRRTIEDFLLNEWQNGALLGEKPEKAFFVKCDRSTMSQNDLDNGRLICLIGVAPLRPAEFVIFRIGQWTADRKV
jgi:phage tail sheath protein FI